MRYVFTAAHPYTTRVLLVESGPRHVLEGLIEGVERNYPGLEQIDLLTCYPGLPRGFDAARGRVYRVQDYRGRAARRALFAELRERRPDVCLMLCTGAPVMTKWKWLAAWHAPAKIGMVNEYSDYFWLDRAHWKILIRFLLLRAGLEDYHAFAHLGQIVLLPFTFTFLALYAAQVHLRRWLRS